MASETSLEALAKSHAPSRDGSSVNSWKKETKVAHISGALRSIEPAKIQGDSMTLTYKSGNVQV
ncbi:MAG: hypothetical protein ACREQP_06570 [Candidatus Binatia bacterium]